MFGQRLRGLRQEQGLTLAQLAERTGLTASNINKYEHGERANPSIETVMRLASALDTTPGYLLGNEDAATHNKLMLSGEERAIITLVRKGLIDAAIELLETMRHAN